MQPGPPSGQRRRQFPSRGAGEWGYNNGQRARQTLVPNPGWFRRDGSGWGPDEPGVVPLMSANAALRACLTPAIALAVLGIQLLSAQDPPASETPPSSGIVLKKTVRRVILDVVVTGPNQKAIRGLSQQDFAVTEDGKPQQILSFEPHEFGSADYVPPKLPPLPPNTYVDIPSQPERGPLNLILYDRLNTSLDDQMVARAQLLKFIRHKPPGSRFAIFVLGDTLRMIQGFTDDENQLVAAVNSGVPGLTYRRRRRPFPPAILTERLNRDLATAGETERRAWPSIN